MIPITFIYTHNDIFQGVKQDSSQLAIRRTDKDGNSMFEQIVFDEAYLIKFRELFFEVQAEVTSIMSAYLKLIPVDPEYFEANDFSKNEDYTFSLLMPDDFMLVMTKSIDITTKQYIIAYIMYRWLETKLSDDAATYFSRAEDSKMKIKKYLERRINPIRRSHRMF